MNPNKERQDNNRFTVTRGGGLLDFLRETLEGKSRGKIKSLLEHRSVTVDGAIVTQFDHQLFAGQTVAILQGKIAPPTGLPGLKIIFEDADLLVIDKRAGLLSIATDREKDKTAHALLNRHVKQSSSKNKIFIVHRLDRDASGLMLFAKNQKIKEIMQKNWHELVLERLYAVVVEGRVAQDQGTLKSWIAQNSAYVMYSSEDRRDAKQAITHFRVVKKSDTYSLLEVQLETGRKNQIRVHMKEMGHSIIGDEKYGAHTNPIGRLGLHSHKLAFLHPATNAALRFESPLPAGFLRLF